MAKKAEVQNARVGKIRHVDGTVIATLSPLGKNISTKNTPQISLSVVDWRKAIDVAQNRHNPRRRPLLDIFQNIQFDGHLEAVMEKRMLAITNKKLLFTVDGSKGEHDETVQKQILEKQWFLKLMSAAMNSLNYGYSLIELVPGDDGLIGDVVDHDRRNVLVDYQFFAFSYVTTEPSHGNGIYYNEDEQYKDYLIEVKSKYSLGKLATAALLIILKRGAISDWADFCQFFGIPTRIGTYNAYDDFTREKLQEALDKMGSAGAITIPEGTTLEIVGGQGGSGQIGVFKDLFDTCNAELSKLYLGQTMTTDNGSSRSQSETHERVEDAINLQDMLFMEHFLNDVVVEKLRKIGYVIPEGRIHFPEASAFSLVDRIKIDMELDKVIPIAQEYWYKTYGITKPTPEEAAAWIEKNKPVVPAAPPVGKPTEENPPVPKKDPPVVPSKKPKPTQSTVELVNAMYKLPTEHLPNAIALPTADKVRDKIWERITKEIHSGKLKPGQIDPELHKWIKAQLNEAVLKGLGDKYIKEQYKAFTDKLTEDVHVFSAFKTYQELRSATDLLKNDEGEVRDFAEFKNLILEIDTTYNITYLEAEYKQAIATSQMGAKWQDLWANKDIAPMLRFTTANDERVRDDHAKLNEIVLPKTDSFWDRYYPPLDWGCRCDVNEELDDVQQTELPSKLPELKDSFAINWGKKGKVFPENHPYYSVRSEDQKQADKLWGLENE
jgi:hypothetical protein